MELTYSALEQVRDWRAAAGARSETVARGAVSANGGFRLLPYHILLIVWSADVALVTLAFALSRRVVLGATTWGAQDYFCLAGAAFCWLAFAGRDLSPSGGAVALRLAPMRLAASWLGAFSLVLCGLLLGEAARGALDRVPPGDLLADGGADATWMLWLFAIGWAALAIGRRAAVAVLRRLARGDLHRDGTVSLRVLVIGDGADVASVATELRRHHAAPTRIVEVLDARGAPAADWPRDLATDPRCEAAKPAETTAWADISGWGALPERIGRDAIDTVVLALPRDQAALMQPILQALAPAPVDIWLVPGLVPGLVPELAPDPVADTAIDRPAAAACRHCGDLPFLRLRARPLSIFQQAIKKLEDMLAGSLLLLLAAVPMLLIALAIRLESPGAILFRQQRRGYGERLITVLKFRTMFEAMRDDHCVQQTVRNDPRVTRVGRVLRRLSLDELPQLINVLRGEMSVVGPRPHALHTRAEGMLFDAVVENYAARHRVKPGITGWAQVNGWRGETDTIEKIVKRVEFDFAYIDSWSLRRDLEIVCKTVLRMPADRKAY